MEEQGFDTAVTADGVFRLLEAAYEVLPDVAELELVRARAGLRPVMPDNRPVIGAGDVDGPAVGDRPRAQRRAAGAAHGEPHRRRAARAGGGRVMPAVTRERQAPVAARRRHRAGRGRGVGRARRTARGVAVALDGEVVPRGEWSATALDEGREVEVLHAVQGG